jgi:hypothetical protein
MVVTDDGGQLQVTTLSSLPANSQTETVAGLKSISCPSDGDCVAVGSYDVQTNGNPPKYGALSFTENGGTWSPGTAVQPPSDANGVIAQLYGVSCIASSQCAAVGSYSGSNGNDQLMTTQGVGGNWAQSDELTLPSSASLYPSLVDIGQLSGVSCNPDAYCAAGGDFSTTSQPANALVATAQLPAVPTTTTVSSSDDPSVAGGPVSFTATVAPSSTMGAVPTGTVQFTVDGQDLGNPVSVSTAGTATSPSDSNLGAGTDQVVATFSGGDAYAESSGSFTQTVEVDSTTTGISSSLNPSICGQDVTFTATISGHGPTGMVTFYDGSSTLGNADLSNGVGRLTTDSLKAGTHAITAVYSGDTRNASSTSAALAQVVRPGVTVTIIVGLTVLELSIPQS